jgi:cation efflux family protein
LIQQYLYIDRLLDSSLPHNILNEYDNMPASSFRNVEIPDTISEEPRTPPSPDATSTSASSTSVPTTKSARHTKVKRTPKDIYRPTETTPLFSGVSDDVETAQTDGEAARKLEIPLLEDDEVDSSAPVVTVAIYVNFAANAFLLAGKIAVVMSVPSVSVLASLVDAILDFLSTAIVWTTTWLISRQDQHRYPVGRRRWLCVLHFFISPH